jgi:hypothetical protein
MKYIVLPAILLAICSKCFSQKAITFYFDKDMNTTSRSQAVFKETGIMDDGLYKLSCYNIASKSLVFVAHYADSTMHDYLGLYQSWYPKGNIKTEGIYHHGNKDGLWKTLDGNGNLTDSILYEDGEKLIEVSAVYYSNKHLESKMINNTKTGQFNYSIYDERGKVIVNDTSRKDNDGVFYKAEIGPVFPGGTRGWIRFVYDQYRNNNIRTNDLGTYLIRFIVDTSGNVSNVEALTMKNSKFAATLVNSIATGTKWIPAQENGKNVKAFALATLFMPSPQ